VEEIIRDIDLNGDGEVDYEGTWNMTYVLPHEPKKHTSYAASIYFRIIML